jgi:hypothetical protein
MKKLSILLTILFISFNATLIYAGWHIVEEEIADGGQSTLTKIWIEKGKFKHSEGEFDFIYDESEELLTYINHKSKTYWTGNLSSYKEEIKHAKKAIMDKTLEGLPPEQRENYRKLLKEQEEALAQQSKSVDVVINNTGIIEKILGFKTTKYEVIVDGELKEELWISKENDFYKDLDYDKFNKIMKEMSQASLDDYTTDDKYTSMFRNSFPMRKVVYKDNKQSNQYLPDGGKITTEVKSAVNESIPDNVFQVPTNYKNVSLVDFMTQ